MTAVLTALGNPWESRVATLLEGSRVVQIVRRCADLADLVATASAGLGSVALVSVDLRGLDLSTVAQLRELGLAVVGVATSDDEGAERRLRQMGVARVVPGGADLAVFEAALTADVTDREPPPVGRPVAAAREGSGAGVDMDPAAETLRRLDPDRPPSAAEGPPGGAEGLTPPGEVTPASDAEPGRIVAVWGPTGAPGRTTVAVTLATELAALGVPTVLVDADTYGGSVAQALSFLDEAPGIAAATRAADQGTLDLPLLARLAPVASPGLRVVTGIPKAERWTEIRAPALERVLTLARRLGQVVVVDCGFNLEDDEELSYDTMA
ncbi:MAG: hypothetical protein ABJA89_00160, partial [Lapillicoccus sp.]